MLKALSIFFFTFYLTPENRILRCSIETNCQYYLSTSLKKKVYTRLEIEPEFPGGTVAYVRFINNNLLIPQDTEDDITTLPMPKLKFIIDVDGQITNPCIQNRYDSLKLNSLEKAMLDLIKKMPKWIPGKCRGQVVAAEVNRPLLICIKLETE